MNEHFSMFLEVPEDEHSSSLNQARMTLWIENHDINNLFTFLNQHNLLTKSQLKILEESNYASTLNNYLGYTNNKTLNGLLSAHGINLSFHDWGKTPLIAIIQFLTEKDSHLFTLENLSTVLSSLSPIAEAKRIKEADAEPKKKNIHWPQDTLFHEVTTLESRHGVSSNEMNPLSRPVFQ